MFQPQPIHLIVVGGKTPPFNDKTAFHNWFNGFFELQMVVHAQPYFIPYRDGQQYGEQWAKVGRYLRREWGAAQGAVVIFPPDQCHTATAYLSLMLGRVGKPVVCIASDTDVADQGDHDASSFQQLNLHTNTVNASQAAVGECSGVLMMTNSEVVFYDPFTAMPRRVGRMDFGVKLNADAVTRSEAWPSGPFTMPEHVYWMSEENREVLNDATLVIVDKASPQQPLSTLSPSFMDVAKHAPVLLLASNDNEHDNTHHILDEHGLISITGPQHTILARALWYTALKEKGELPEEWKGRSLGELLNNPL